MYNKVSLLLLLIISFLTSSCNQTKYRNSILIDDQATDKGGAVGGAVSLDDITIYQLTESGLALQATVKGTKYWKDDALN